MDQVTEAIGNPTALLVERIFWLCIGGFLGLAIITSLIRGLEERKNNSKSFSPKGLEDISKKTIERDML